MLQHVAERAAGVTHGFPALPCFVAASAQAAQTALLHEEAPNIDALVLGLTGGSSAAVVEHCKAVIAATLAAPRPVIKACAPALRCIGARSLRKAMHVGDIDLLTLLVWVDQHFAAVN